MKQMKIKVNAVNNDEKAEPETVEIEDWQYLLITAIENLTKQIEISNHKNR